MNGVMPLNPPPKLQTYVVFLFCIFLCYVFPCCNKIISLSATDSSAICLEDFWLDSKEYFFSELKNLRLIHYLVIFLFLCQEYLREKQKKTKFLCCIFRVVFFLLYFSCCIFLCCIFVLHFSVLRFSVL